MAILLLETLRLSGSLERYDGVTRECSLELTQIKLVLIKNFPIVKNATPQKAKLGKRG
jgi:hypothetical protein